MPTLFGKVQKCFIILQNYKHDHNEGSLYYSFMWSIIVNVALWAKIIEMLHKFHMVQTCPSWETIIASIIMRGFRSKNYKNQNHIVRNDYVFIHVLCFMLKIARERLPTWQSESQKTQKGQGLFQGSQKSFWIFVMTIERKALFLK